MNRPPPPAEWYCFGNVVDVAVGDAIARAGEDAPPKCLTPNRTPLLPPPGRDDAIFPFYN